MEPRLNLLKCINLSLPRSVLQVCKNQMSLFIRGIGGFGGDRGPADQLEALPTSPPSAVSSQVCKCRDLNQEFIY